MSIDFTDFNGEKAMKVTEENSSKMVMSMIINAWISISISFSNANFTFNFSFYI